MVWADADSETSSCSFASLNPMTTDHVASGRSKHLAKGHVRSNNSSISARTPSRLDKLEFSTLLDNLDRTLLVERDASGVE
jgi:hypothetical protein